MNRFNKKTENEGDEMRWSHTLLLGAILDSQELGTVAGGFVQLLPHAFVLAGLRRVGLDPFHR
jgi:hypothetical protein